MERITNRNIDSSSSTMAFSTEINIEDQADLSGFDQSIVKESIEEFHYKIENPKIVAQNFSNLLFQPQFSDLEMIVGDSPVERIHAHRQILAASSEVFAAMFFGPFSEGQTKEVRIPNIQPRIFKALLQFIYTATIEVNIENIVPLFQAADQYAVIGAKQELLKAAELFMSQASTEQSYIFQVLRLLNDAYTADILEIQTMCMEFIDLHTLEILESDSILALPKELMIVIFKSDFLSNGLEEIQLYLAALRWARGSGTLDCKDEAQFNCADIKEDSIEDLKEILKCVRIPLIPAEMIITKIAPSNLIDIQELYKATAFQAAPDCFKNTSDEAFRHRHGSEAPWTWSKDAHAPHILLSNNYTVAFGCHYDWEKVLGNTVWLSGIHKFEVQIELNMLASNNTWQIVVGVAHPTSNLKKCLGLCPKEWGFICLSGHKLSNNANEEYASSSRRGEVIGVIVDLNTGRLEFTRNGVSLGLAYRNVKGPISPCVSLVKGQKVSLCHGNTTTKSPLAMAAIGSSL